MLTGQARKSFHRKQGAIKSIWKHQDGNLRQNKSNLEGYSLFSNDQKLQKSMNWVCECVGCGQMNKNTLLVYCNPIQNLSIMAYV